MQRKSTDYQSLLTQRGRSHWWAAGMRRVGWALLGEARGRTLDIGCGPGWDLAELPGAAWRIGLDHDHRAVFFRPLVLGDAARLPFEPGACALVLALDLLEQRGVAPPQVLAEVRRVLAPGGRVLIRVPAHPWLFGPHDRFWGGARRYRKQELATLVTGAGFTLRRLTYANCVLFPLAAVGRLLARVTGRGGDDLWLLPGPVNRLLLGVLTLEARWLRRHDLPMGLSLLCLAEHGAHTANTQYPIPNTR